jgi:hypothetical protein
MVLALSWAPKASAQVDAQVGELNTQALEAYQALDIDAAKAKLEEAVGLAQKNNLTGPTVAQTYMNLAVVFIAGANDRDQGLTAFVTAVCMQSDIQLDPLLSTPDVQQVFLQAQQDAQSGACGPGSAAPAAAPVLVPTAAPTGPQKEDVECPPGVQCGADGEVVEPTEQDFARFFVNLEFALGASFVGQGMKADSKPPLSEVIGAVDFVDTNGDKKLDAADAVLQDGVARDLNGDGTPDNRYYFDNKSAWVPDADSYDDYEEPGNIARGTDVISPDCSADGKPSGPVDLSDMDGNAFTTIEPTSYCARVSSEGFVPSVALRLNPGYFITDTFAVSLPIRFQFSAGEGSLSHMLIGIRGELMFRKMEHATGFPISWFFGATYGQIQAKAPPKDPKRPSPFIVSGPLGLHTGVNFRFRIHKNFGFIVAPEFDVQLPDFMIHADLSAGVEGAF